MFVELFTMGRVTTKRSSKALTTASRDKEASKPEKSKRTEQQIPDVNSTEGIKNAPRQTRKQKSSTLSAFPCIVLSETVDHDNVVTEGRDKSVSNLRPNVSTCEEWANDNSPQQVTPRGDNRCVADGKQTQAVTTAKLKQRGIEPSQKFTSDKKKQILRREHAEMEGKSLENELEQKTKPLCNAELTESENEYTGTEDADRNEDTSALGIGQENTHMPAEQLFDSSMCILDHSSHDKEEISPSVTCSEKKQVQSYFANQPLADQSETPCSGMCDASTKEKQTVSYSSKEGTSVMVSEPLANDHVTQINNEDRENKKKVSGTRVMGDTPSANVDSKRTSTLVRPQDAMGSQVTTDIQSGNCRRREQNMLEQCAVNFLVHSNNQSNNDTLSGISTDDRTGLLAQSVVKSGDVSLLDGCQVKTSDEVVRGDSILQNNSSLQLDNCEISKKKNMAQQQITCVHHQDVLKLDGCEEKTMLREKTRPLVPMQAIWYSNSEGKVNPEEHISTTKTKSDSAKNSVLSMGDTDTLHQESANETSCNEPCVEDIFVATQSFSPNSETETMENSLSMLREQETCPNKFAQDRPRSPEGTQVTAGCSPDDMEDGGITDSQLYNMDWETEVHIAIPSSTSQSNNRRAQTRNPETWRSNSGTTTTGLKATCTSLGTSTYSQSRFPRVTSHSPALPAATKPTEGTKVVLSLIKELSSLK